MKKNYEVHYRHILNNDYQIIGDHLDQRGVLKLVRKICTHRHSEGEGFKVYEVVGEKKNKVKYVDWF